MPGCLPTLATLPIFWGLYRTLTNVASAGLLVDGFYFIPSLAGPTSVAQRMQGEIHSGLFAHVACASCNGNDAAHGIDYPTTLTLLFIGNSGSLADDASSACLSCAELNCLLTVYTSLLTTAFVHLSCSHSDQRSDGACCMAGSGISWLWPLMDGAPPIGWDEASRYLVLPVLLVVAQFVSSAIITPPVDPEDESAKRTQVWELFVRDR